MTFSLPIFLSSHTTYSTTTLITKRIASCSLAVLFSYKMEFPLLLTVVLHASLHTAFLNKNNTFTKSLTNYERYTIFFLQVEKKNEGLATFIYSVIFLRYLINLKTSLIYPRQFKVLLPLSSRSAMAYRLEILLNRFVSLFT